MRALRLLSLLLVLACLVPAAEAGPQRGEAASAAPAAQRPPRILYASDWSGTSQLYAVDPSGRGVTGQLTFGRPPACITGTPCGFAWPMPSPDGRRVLFWGYAVQGSLRPTLFESLADGRKRLRLGSLRSFPREAVWAPDSRRIAYTGTDGVHVVNADGSRNSRVRLDSADRSPAWSAGGRWLAFINSAPTHGLETLRVVRRGTVSTVARSDRYDLDFRWSPVGNVLAYTSYSGLYIVPPTGFGGRRLAERAFDFSWSPDGRQLAFVGREGLKLVNVARRSVRAISAGSAYELAWSPTGRHLAFVGGNGHIRVATVATGAIRELGPDPAGEPAWSPDGRSLAYRAETGASTDSGVSSDLRITTLSGVTRTVVAAAGSLGGAIRGFAWTKPPADLRYRPPARRALATVEPGQLVAPWPVERIASDGSRIAYAACGHVFVWTPASGDVVQAEATSSMSPACSSPSYYTSYRLYSLGLAGDWVAYGSVYGGNSKLWWLGGTRGPSVVELGRGSSTSGPVFRDVIGELAGSGDLLVFASWKEESGPTPGSAVTTAQDIRRAVPTGCPCPRIASSPGPLVPLDVDRGRVVAGGDNETWLLDELGARLLAIQISPAAAQLSGSDLVVLRRGELRHYDAASGGLLHTWPLPDVPGGRECASPNGIRCFRESSRLVLEDAARGLVAYVLDGQVHVLRLADGTDVAVAPGTAARFVDAGLVYADGSRLHLVPFDRLPRQREVSALNGS